jgi:glycogen debranching enzyme
MPILFARDTCCDLEETLSREWLITNGLGGYAAGTLAGTLTRLQHGLLVTPLEGTTRPHLLVAKCDEEVTFDQRTYYLGTNEYQDGTLNPAGFVHLESFRLEEGFPIFTYRLGGLNGLLLEKRIWMLAEQRTTCIQYRVFRASRPQNETNRGDLWRGSSYNNSRGYSRPFQSLANTSEPLTLTLLPFVAYRPYDQPQYGNEDWHFEVQSLPAGAEIGEATDGELPRGVAGCRLRASADTPPYHVLAVGPVESQARFIPTNVWYWRFLRRQSQTAGLAPTDDLYLPGVLRARLWPDKDAALTVLLTAEEPSLQPLGLTQLQHSYVQALDYQRSLLQTPRYFGEGGGSFQSLPVLPLTETTGSSISSEEFLQLLHQAGHRLLIQRGLPRQDYPHNANLLFHSSEPVPVIPSGYFDTSEHTRDMLIALPGLLIATRRYSEAQGLLRTLSRFFRQGLLPGRLPTPEKPDLTETDYDGIDTTLWYCYALDKYLSATRDYELLEEVFTSLDTCINHYVQGTLHGIGVDPADGLLRTGSSSLPLTWMNARARGVAVTPRNGKAVEVNALWFHALSLMQEWAQFLYQRGRIPHPEDHYTRLSERCQQSFNRRFWHPEQGYLYDVIDGPDGRADPRLRPNQLLALSLRYAVLSSEYQTSVLDIITGQLLTPTGLRTLAPSEADYQGRLLPHYEELPRVIHQGAAWPWLIGPYIDALIRDDIPSGHSQRGRNTDHYKEHLWRKGLEILDLFRQQMQRDMLGNVSSFYDGDAPQRSGPQVVSALSIGELLRSYTALAHLGIQHLDQVISA